MGFTLKWWMSLGENIPTFCQTKLRDFALAACWTHDVIEDCRQPYNDLAANLGKPIAEIIYAPTSEKGRNRKERANDKYYEGIRNTPLASFVKVCDRLDHINYSKYHGGKMLGMYQKDHENFIAQLFTTSNYRAQAHVRRIDNVAAVHDAWKANRH